ncbi:MAG: radical SAM protein [Pontiellaceae bacterium]|nr:radical SAM protein [Pontiellaceae bacterium]MBN2785141.1 radical SAM protein [Pontiellaceae bacterium]
MKRTLGSLVKNTGFHYEFESRGYSKGSAKDCVPSAWLLGKYLAKGLINRATGRLELDYAEMYLTTHCSLQCRDCAVLVPYLKKRRHFSKESLLKDMDRFLQSVNYVHRFGLVGGEPLLHPDLPDLIRYLSGHPAVGTIRIPTNSTVLPGPELIDALKSSPDVLLSISEYPIELCPKRPRLIDLLERNGIEYEVYAGQAWDDLGACSSAYKEGVTEEELALRFSNCWMRECHGVLEGRFYLCGRAAFAPLAGIHDAFPEDGVDLYGVEDAKGVRRAISDLMNKPYLRACAYCRGTSSGKRIAPAIQVGAE